MMNPAAVLEERGVLAELRKAGAGAFYSRFSALDRFFRLGGLPFLSLKVSQGIIDLAMLFPGLRYPGLANADAALSRQDGQDVYFSCADAETGGASWALWPAPETGGEFFPVLELLYDPFRDVFLDAGGIYPLLRLPFLSVKKSAAGSGLSFCAVADAAILVSRYGYTPEAPALLRPDPATLGEMNAESQRLVLASVLASDKAFAGLTILRDSGFAAALWPELAALGEVSHSKEYHPEGGGWEHTLETFRYRKTKDFRVSLALLCHDMGKPRAGAQQGRRFDGHAEIGAALAEKFLRRLGFPETLVSGVRFLVRNHMLPAALKSLPAWRTEEVMASELFPLLLEVYRCDLSSTFRGPEPYYEACAIYRTFLKRRKNPFRPPDRKKPQRPGARSRFR